MLIKLGDISEIYMGIVPNRKKVDNEFVKSKVYKMFSITNYNENKTYDDFHTEENVKKYQAKEGDLIFKLAYPYKVIYVNKNISNILISNQFCIIRVNSNKVDSKYIKWFLETKDVEAQLEKTSTGSVIKTAKVNGIKEIEIPNISLKEQREIGIICTSWDRQKILLNNLIKEKEKYYYQSIKDRINLRGI